MYIIQNLCVAVKEFSQENNPAGDLVFTENRVNSKDLAKAQVTRIPEFKDF